MRGRSIMKLFSVKDVKSSIFLNPLPARSTPEATRIIALSASNPESTLAKFPADFELWFIGDFDELSGILTSTPSFVASVNEIKESYNAQG